MKAELKKKFCNVTWQVIDLYLALCEECQLKKKTPKRGLVVRPVLSHYLNSRCQADLIDMQSEPDGITNYQDHVTKFTILRPLKSKTEEEVAYQLMDIFCMSGAPFTLQSNNGREFANKIIKTRPMCGQEWSSCMENRDILKVKDQLKDLTKMFETGWLPGCPITTWKPCLKDYGLPKARHTEFCIQASRQALMRLCLEGRIGSELGILRSLNTCTLP